MRGFRRYATLSFAAAAFALSPHSHAQEQQEDSLVRLLDARSARIIEMDGQNIRKVIGPARFLHNDTYLLCDTALWNVNTGIIDAIGNVSLIQDGTVLDSDKMVYNIDQSLAEFRGHLVQLRDKDGNTLRTSHLDYNTRDSVAVFDHGGSMRDSEGQIIESVKGTYDSKIKVFNFMSDVNMFTDSIFVKTATLKYESDRNFATFGRGTDAWKDDNMLSSEAGWYDREREIFFFRDNVHVMTDTREGWSDSLYFYRNTSDVDMRGHAQVTDTVQSVSGVAGRIFYKDAKSCVTMTRSPAVIAEFDDSSGRDTLYFGADTLIYKTIKYCDIDSVYLADAEKRLREIEIDPVSEYRRKSAEEAARAAAEAAKNDPNRPPDTAKRPSGNRDSSSPAASSSGPQPPGSQTGSSGQAPAPPESSSGPSEVPAVPPRDSTAASAPDGSSLPVVSSDSDENPPVLSSGSGQTGELPDSLRTVCPEEVDPPEIFIDTPKAADSLSVAGSAVSSGLTDSLAVSVPADSLGVPALRDSLGVSALPDSLGMPSGSAFPADSVEVVPPDTTKMGFVTALRNVKVFRKNMQIVCDSLEYSDVDSLARLFGAPIIWDEITRQYCADSITAVIRNGAMEKANLMSEAFIHIQEDDTHFDQIKSTEMTAYFDPDGGMTRFDALGGAFALFFLQEKDALATVNKKESKMLSAEFENGEIHHIRYYDGVKSDAYPVVQLSHDEQLLKGFNWQPEKRPEDRNAVTTLQLRPLQRAEYESRPRAEFKYTETYFSGYMSDIYVQIAVRDSLAKVRAERRRIEQLRREAAAAADSLARADSLAAADSLYGNVPADSLALADSLAHSDSLAMTDSLAAAADSLAAADSVRAFTDTIVKPDKKALREQAAAERKAAREARNKAREERWAELDRKDAEKAAAKREKRQAKLRERKRKMLEAAEKQARKDAAVLDAYVKAFEAKEAKKSARKAAKRSGAGKRISHSK